MTTRNMFSLIDSGYAGKWAQPGLDQIGPTNEDAKRQQQREALIRARGKKPRKSYYERQLDKFGIKGEDR